MSEQNDKLIKYEPDYIEGEIVRESYFERKKRELVESLLGRKVQEPISMTALLTSLAISAATTGASYLLSRAFAPKPKPIEKGRTTGQLVISSQLGVLISEAYFGDPGDGLGGTWLPAIVISLSPISKQVNVSRQEVGGGKGGGRQTQEVQEIVYYFPYLALMYGRGSLRALRLKANSDVIFDLYGQVSTYEGESASSYTGTTQVNPYEAASGGYEVTLGPSGTVQWDTVQSNGAATRQLTFRYRTDESTPMPIEYTVNGGAAVPITLPTTNESFMRHTISVALVDGLNTFKIQNKHLTKNLGIDSIYCFPGHTDKPTGVLDPTTIPDDPYDPATPEDPTLPYERPYERFSAEASMDEYATQTGTLIHAGQFAFYEGNYEQLPDPTMQAAIDALYGADSTPAYRGRAIEVDTVFYLTRWGNAIPNRTGLFENVIIRTLEQFCNDRCIRVGIGDYDFSDFEEILPRGLRMLGQRYEAREHMTHAETLFNIYFTEEDFKIKGKLQTGTSVATLTDEDFGWIEGDELPEDLLSFDITEPDATRLPKRVEIKHLSLDREGDPGLQGYGRHETVGVETETLDYSDWTFVNDEAQEIAQRVTYQRYVEKPVRFNLSWKYLWLIAGQVITANLASGYSYKVQVDKIAGGVGVLECEGHLVDVPVFTQPVSTGSGEFGIPTSPIPAMTILALLDIPLRDKDETENNGYGQYIGGTPRTNSGQVWTGYSAHINDSGWQKIADGTLPATIGVIVSFAGLLTTTTGWDYSGEIVFDVYHTDTFSPVLESVSVDDIAPDQNILAISTPDGEILTQFANAEQVSANRWKVTTLRHGLKGTEHLVESYEVGRRVVHLNEAIQFVPMNISRLNKPYDYTAPSFGQSLDDTAVLEDVVWTGVGKKPLSPVIYTPALRDSEGDLLIEPFGRTRIGGGFISGQFGAINEEKLVYKAQPLDAGSPILPNGRERVMTFEPGMPIAAFLKSSSGDFTGVTQNSFQPATPLSARSMQEIPGAGNYMEGVMRYGFLGESVAFGLQAIGGPVALQASDLSDFYSPGGTVAGTFAMPYLVLIESITFGGFNGNRMHVFEYGTRVFSASSLASQPDYDADFGWLSTGDIFRVRFNFIGSTVRIQKTHTLAVPYTTIYTGTRAAQYPMFGFCAAGGDSNSGVLSITMTTLPFAKTIYSHAQQEEDFGSVQSSVEFDVWQWSPTVGDGKKLRITL